MRRPGRSRRARGIAFLVAAALASTGCASLLFNFGTVAEGRIYRSAQPSPLLLRWAVERHGIRTLVNLRGSTEGYESAFAARHGLRLFSFNLKSSREPPEEEVGRFLQILNDPACHPVLVHCRAGVDRTGYMLGIYRVTEGGWTAEQATREMLRYRQLELLKSEPKQIVRRYAAGEATAPASPPVCGRR